MPCSAAIFTILFTSGRSSKAGGPTSSPSAGIPAFWKKSSYKPPASGSAASCPPPYRCSCAYAKYPWARRGANPRPPAGSAYRLGTHTVLRARRRPRPRGGGRGGWPCPGWGSSLEEHVRPAGLLAWDLVGQELAQHPQRFCALARQDVGYCLLRLSVFHPAGFVTLCKYCCVAHLKAPFWIHSPGTSCLNTSARCSGSVGYCTPGSARTPTSAAVRGAARSSL